MGASSSVLDSEGGGDGLISEEDKLKLTDVSTLLKAYNIKNGEDLTAVNEKYQGLKAKGSHGFELLKGLHHEMHQIGDDNGRPGDALAAVVDQARERVKVLMRQVSQENYVNFMVGLDGSRASDNAYEVCMQELIKSRDGIIGLHCYDSTKTDAELKDCFKPEALRERFDVDLTVRSNKGRYKLLWVNKHGEPTHSFLLKTVNGMCVNRDVLDIEDRPSFFVTGITGRKEAKAQNKIGTLPLLAAGQFLIPNIIVKCEPVVDRARIFVCAVKDLGHVEPYLITLDLIKPGNGDKIFVVNVHQNDRASKEKIEEFETYFSTRIKEDGLAKNGSKFIPIPNDNNEPSHLLVLKALDDLEADYVTVYPHIQVVGAAAPNNCALIVEKSPCNIIICRR